MAQKLRILSTFKKDFSKLPNDIKEKTGKQLGFLITNPDHPSLKVHLIRGTNGIWEGRIDYHYRFTFEVDGDGYTLRKIGTHDVLKNP